MQAVFPGKTTRGWLVPGGLIALFTALASVVQALTPPPDQVRRSWEKRFAELDRNRDGKVSRAEYLSFFGAATGARRQYFDYEFHLYDRNRDGFISREEHAAPVQPEWGRPPQSAGVPLSPPGAGFPPAWTAIGTGSSAGRNISSPPDCDGDGSGFPLSPETTGAWGKKAQPQTHTEK